jgi:hypothetical protein
MAVSFPHDEAKSPPEARLAEPESHPGRTSITTATGLTAAGFTANVEVPPELVAVFKIKLDQVRAEMAAKQPGTQQTGAPLSWAVADHIAVRPRTYEDAKIVAEQFRAGSAVVMDLTQVKDRDARRFIDFAAGLVAGLGGALNRVDERVFQLAPAEPAKDYPEAGDYSDYEEVYEDHEEDEGYWDVEGRYQPLPRPPDPTVGASEGRADLRAMLLRLFEEGRITGRVSREDMERIRQVLLGLEEEDHRVEGHEAQGRRPR